MKIENIKIIDEYGILYRYDIYDLYDFLDSYKKYIKQKTFFARCNEYEIIYRKHKDKYLIKNTNIDQNSILHNWYYFNSELNKIITR